MDTSLSNFRRRSGALSIFAFLAALLAGTLLQPTDSHANVDQLRAAVLHPGAMLASAWFEIAAGILAPVVVLTLVSAVRHRGTVLAHVGGAIGIIGSVGMTLIGVHTIFVVALAERGGPAALAVLDQMNQLAPVVVLFFFALPVALVILAGAVARAGLAPLWVVPAAIAFLVVDQTPLPEAELIQMAIGIVTFGWISVRILRLQDKEVVRQSSEPLTARGSAIPETAG